MKTLHFFESKRPILTFEAEDLSYAPDGMDAEGAPEFLVTAGGAITFQDMPLVEELIHGVKPSCFLQVKEGEQTLLDGRFRVTFLVLEPDQLVIRLSIAGELQ